MKTHYSLYFLVTFFIFNQLNFRKLLNVSKVALFMFSYDHDVLPRIFPVFFLENHNYINPTHFLPYIRHYGDLKINQSKTHERTGSKKIIINIRVNIRFG